MMHGVKKKENKIGNGLVEVVHTSTFLLKALNVQGFFVILMEMGNDKMQL